MTIDRAAQTSAEDFESFYGAHFERLVGSRSC